MHIQIEIGFSTDPHQSRFYYNFVYKFIRWDDVEIARLPEYMRPLYKAVLELYEQFEEELDAEGRSYTVNYAIEAVRFMSLN